MSRHFSNRTSSMDPPDLSSHKQDSEATSRRVSETSSPRIRLEQPNLNPTEIEMLSKMLKQRLTQIDCKKLTNSTSNKVSKPSASSPLSSSGNCFYQPLDLSLFKPSHTSSLASAKQRFEDVIQKTNRTPIPSSHIRKKEDSLPLDHIYSSSSSSSSSDSDSSSDIEFDSFSSNMTSHNTTIQYRPQPSESSINIEEMSAIQGLMKMNRTMK